MVWLHSSVLLPRKSLVRAGQWRRRKRRVDLEQPQLIFSSFRLWKGDSRPSNYQYKPLSTVITGKLPPPSLPQS